MSVKLNKKGRNMSTPSHTHGSVKNGYISPIAVIFHKTMITGRKAVTVPPASSTTIF